jgi:PilZ domain-containing protein
MQVPEVAPRFSLNLPMRYRPAGESEWRKAKTVNVSASGLLFVASEPLPAGRQLEVEISMTTTLLKPSRVSATSEVLRQGTEAEPLLTTVRHLQYRMMEGDVE